MNVRIIFIMQLISISLVFIYIYFRIIYQHIRLKKHNDFCWQDNPFGRIRYSFLLFAIVPFMELSVMGLLLSSEKYIQANIREEDLSVQIEEVAKGLSESSQTLLSIQTELENRISTVEELKKEAEIAENMISLTEEQVTAIQSKLNQELEASSGKSLLYSILISTVFFILGWIAKPIYNFFKKKPATPTQQDKFLNGKYTEDEIAQAIRLLETIEEKQIQDSSTS